MKAEVRRKLDMADRVLVFAAAHPLSDAGAKAVVDELSARVTHARELAAQQQTGLLTSRGGTVRRRELRARLHEGLLRYLVRVGEAAARDMPALAQRFHLPRLNGNNRNFIVAATTMLAEARANVELFGKFGMTESLVAELSEMLTEYTKSIEESVAARQQHIGASADLDQVGFEIVQLVERINGYTRHTFRENPDILAAWESARNVFGPVKRKAETETPTPPAGPTPDVSKAA